VQQRTNQVAQPIRPINYIYRVVPQKTKAGDLAHIFTFHRMICTIFATLQTCFAPNTSVTGSFPNELKLLVSVLSLKVGMQQIFQITGLSQYCPVSPKFMKDWYIIG